jgi:hypothetical protein
MDPFDSSPFGGGGMFNFMFTLIPILIGIVFVIVIGGIILNGVRYVRNTRAPKQSTYARVVAKRTDVRTHGSSHHHGGGDNGLHHHHTNRTRTYYYITLEFDNGDRREYLDVKGLYGLLVEGDAGYAMTQGEWIVAFERQAG